ncbi:MAG: hypothetical protein QG555_1377 [Thermodesulfobacteriota bacterium]|nr:hypothetical protein [Thermodesulfobacteriota bacterium]
MKMPNPKNIAARLSSPSGSRNRKVLRYVPLVNPKNLRIPKLSPIFLAVAVIIVLGPAAVSAIAQNGPPGKPPEKFTLSSSIAMAMNQSMVIQAAKEGVKGAEAQKKEAFTGFFPKLSTSYSYTSINSPFGPLATTGGQVTMGTQDNYSWAMEVRQPIFAGGTIAANYEANKKGEDIARVDESTTTQTLVEEVKASYFNILKAQKMLEVARQAVEQLKSHRNEAQNFFDVGLIPKNDLLQSEVQLANGEHSLVKAENNLEIAKARFNTLLRRGINASVEVEDILTYRPFEKTIEACFLTAFDKRPEIKAYALKVEQAKEYVKAAKGDFFPTVSAVGHYERYGDTGNLQGSPYKSMENWYLMARADWTFWEWGKTKNQVDSRQARQNQTTSLLAHEKDKVAFEVKAAYVLVRESEKQVFVARKSIDQAEENFRINSERYKEQVATSTDVLDAQTLLTKAKSDYFTALGDYYINQARLERAMGEIR